VSARRIKLEQLRDQFPEDPEIIYGLAMDTLGDENFQGAILEFQGLLHSHPEFVPAYLQLGQILTREMREDEASDVYRQGITKAVSAGNKAAADEMARFLDMIS
jgi:Tfp pilus assembly protein PilF